MKGFSEIISKLPFSLNLPVFLGRSNESGRTPWRAWGSEVLRLTTDSQLLLCCQETIQGKEGEAHGRDDSMPQK